MLSEVTIPDVDYGKLKTEIENQLRLMNLQATTSTGNCSRMLHVLA